MVDKELSFKDQLPMTTPTKKPLGNPNWYSKDKVPAKSPEKSRKSNSGRIPAKVVEYVWKTHEMLLQDKKDLYNTVKDDPKAIKWFYKEFLLPLLKQAPRELEGEFFGAGGGRATFNMILNAAVEENEQNIIDGVQHVEDTGEEGISNEDEGVVDVKEGDYEV
jgi:hypothetical protein